ncbi:U4/U6.U5 tri-snRNP-associated protein 1 [Morella rubra]|uniref:U4/U6.U5 tri-snRNP-associated protein 1 n=1 Tax=Morella rubra TaxID=262757 RepID=A0A6A1VUG0_9ROSI|nr:U4/U6.U5 tri-snRNP-associated protein 1 [Morella rubra]
MDVEWSDSRYEHSEERDDSPLREHRDGGVYDDSVQNGADKSSKHRSKDRKKSGRGEDKEHKNKDRERSKRSSDDLSKEKEKEVRDSEKDRVSIRDRRKEDRDEWDKDRNRDIKDMEREKGKDKTREKEWEADQDKERLRERDRASRKFSEEDYDWSRDDESKLDNEDDGDREASKHGKMSRHTETEENAEASSGGAHLLTSELEERILKKREERLNKKSEGVSEILSWVSRSRKLEEKRIAEKEKALHLSKVFEEQDNIGQGDSDDEEGSQHTAHNLAGVKVLHGLDKVIEGGAVVLTLKDQNILADGDINADVDMLENVEIGEQKRRDEAYKAAKKKTGIYDDKFNDEPGVEKKILPQYDDPTADEGLALDERGHISGEAEKKLQELRKRLEGASSNNRFEDLNSVGKISSDYFTQEEMLKFKKPKKKKSLRKKEKLDLDALEEEARSAGLGVGDLGSRNDARRQAVREEQQRAEAELRNNAYQSAYAKADEASRSLQLEQTLPVKLEEDENPVFADDDEDLYKSLERARKIALKNQEGEVASGPQAIALIATTNTSSQTAEDQNPTTGESQENKVVFTEMEEFVWGLQLDEEARKPENEDVFMQEDEEPKASEEEKKDEAGGWTEVKDISKDEHPADEDMEEIVPDETIHEVAVGKGLSGALKLLKERGTLKESIDWGGRNMDKKRSKLVGIMDREEPKEPRSSSLIDFKKEIRIDRTDEFGRIMTPKEAFRMISHKFHGKGPGKMKQEKRMKQYHEELKLKQMKNSDTPSLSVERMREAQMQLKTPYLVLSGHVKPGQTSDPRSGFATVEKDLPGGLTPMLGDRKVEHFLGIKRKAEPANSGAPKKPKP